MYIDLIDETEQVTAEHFALVEKVIHFASDYLQLSQNIECAITFVDNARIQEINRLYRDKDMPTDVISFALDDAKEDEVMLEQVINSSYAHHLGDIIISIDKVDEQAKEYGHSFERELAFLAVHGFLHLNGYDHMTETDEQEMFALQHTILNDFGLGR